ncbi:MAG: T9SS type A sorting domain-containing protein [Candidatus Marinimicrobia bacterium]|nr:T9SS type A sorting domain-containing protein [Candidatus Neomarinimicrobiota bacterium]
MKKLLTVLLLLSAVLAFAGEGYYFDELLFSFLQEDSVLVNYELADGTDGGNQFGPHGLVIDAAGKMWVGFHNGYSRQLVEADNDTITLRGVHCFMPDGTPATFSPIEFLEFEDGSKDTIFAESYANGSCKGVTLASDGNILVTSWSTLFKIDYATGEGMFRWYPKMESSTYAHASMTEAAIDAELGLVYIGYVGGAQPVYALDEDLAFVSVAIPSVPSTDRSILARSLTDGTGQIFVGTIWSGTGIHVYESADPEFEAFEVVDTLANISMMVEDTLVTFNGWVECMDWVDVDDGIIIYGGYTDPVVVTTKVKKPVHIHKSKWVLYDLNNDIELASIGEYYPAAVANQAVLEMPINADVPVDSLGGQPMAQTPRGAAFAVEGDHYKFWLIDMDLGTVQTVTWKADPTAIGSDRYVPYGFSLEQNYPNPFNPTTSISFNILENLEVSVDVYDLAGAKVATVYNGYMEAGSHNMTFDASDLASGTYVYQLTAGNNTVSRKITLVK